MKVYLKFFSCVFIIICIIGCSSQDNKKSDDNKAPVVSKPKNFERPTPPPMMTDQKDRAGYILEHFWDKFDFTDTMYCHVPEITEEAFLDFLYIFQFASKEKINSAVKKLLDQAQVDVVMYNYFYRKGEDYLYNPNSTTRNDEYFIPFLEHLIFSSRVIEQDKERPRYMLALAYKNRLGEKALDFIYTLNSGATGNLYSITTKYTLLMFFNPDCKECRETTAEIKRSTAISSAISAGALKVLAVYPDEDLEIWKSHLNDIPASWINGYDKTQTVKNEEIYDLKAIPLLYLLDKGKIVLLKDATVKEIHDYLEKNQ
jgi:hypothetical protein